MLQGPDPFDEYRSRRKVEQLEGDIRTEAERKRARMRELLGREEDEDEKVRRRVDAEMEDFFHASETVDASPVEEPPFEIPRPAAPVHGGNDERRAPAPAPSGDRRYDDLQAALDRLRRAGGAETAPPPPPPSPAPVRAARERDSDHDPDTPDWLDLTEERIARPGSAELDRATDDFDFGGDSYQGPITRARQGVIDPFATPQKVAPKPVDAPSARPSRGDSAPLAEPPPLARPDLGDIASDTRLRELERRMAKLEAAMDRLVAMVEARGE